MPAPKVLNGKENLLLSTCSSPQFWLPCIALTISFLIKSHELDSEPDSVNHCNSLFPLSLVVLEGKIPVLPAQVPGVPGTRTRCTWLQTQLPRAMLGCGVTKLGQWAPKFNPPSHRDSLPGQGIGPWNGIVTTVGQKFTADIGSVQWNTCRKHLLIHSRG